MLGQRNGRRKHKAVGRALETNRLSHQLKEMALAYGDDISNPLKTQGSGAVALLCISGRHKRAKQRRYVARPGQHILDIYFEGIYLKGN